MHRLSYWISIWKWNKIIWKSVFTWLDSSSSNDSSLAMGASSVDLNSQDSVVPASEPLESSRFDAFQPSSEYWEEEDEEGNRRLCSLGGRSDVLQGRASGSPSPNVKGRDFRSLPRLGSVITPSCHNNTHQNKIKINKLMEFFKISNSSIYITFLGCFQGT